VIGQDSNSRKCSDAMDILEYNSSEKQLKTKLRGFSPQANYLYTDRATAADQRSWCQILRMEGVAWSAERIPTAVNLDFLDPEPLLFHSSSSSFILMRLNGPRYRPTIFQKIW
jgi:hypothetical protein